MNCQDVSASGRFLTKPSAYHKWLGVVLTVSYLLAGCMPIRVPSKAPESPLFHTDSSPTSALSVDVRNPARGYWETVAGDVPPRSQDVNRIYDYNWYAIETYTAGAASVTWDDGLACTQTRGRIQGNEIQLTAGDVEASFVFQDATHATATFRRGQATYVKQLQKTRDDPTPACA